MKKIYLDNSFKHIKGERVNTFIKRFILNSYYTKTYSDPEKTEEQCPWGKYRSIDDILKIIHTRYPNITLEHICKNFKKVIESSDNLSFFYCPDIRKWMFVKAGRASSKYQFMWNYKDSDKKIKSTGNCKMTYYKFMKLMGYSDEEMKK